MLAHPGLTASLVILLAVAIRLMDAKSTWHVSTQSVVTRAHCSTNNLRTSKPIHAFLITKPHTNGLAFIGSTSSGVVASLFGCNLWKRKRRRYHVSFETVRAGEAIFSMDDSSLSSTLDQHYKIDASCDILGAVTSGAGAATDGSDKANDMINTNEEGEGEDCTEVPIHIYHHDGNFLDQVNGSTKNTTLFYKNAMLVGLGGTQNQFALGVQYHLNTVHTPLSEKTSIRPNNITSQMHTVNIDWEHDKEYHLPILHRFWKEEKLICEHTSLLSSKRREAKRNTAIDRTSSKKNGTADNDQKMKDQLIKSENFRDALFSYVDRMVGIVEDELSDVHQVFDSNVQLRQSNHTVPIWNNSKGLLGWLEHEYGLENTTNLMANSLLMKSESEQLKTVHSFLLWFKERFPYYYDKCLTCGASCKDSPVLTNSSESNVDEDDIDDDVVSFIGYLYPSLQERLGNASRTELYRCRTCESFTRFPRYNRAVYVASTKRGRCGEYSMLLYRMFRSLGYEKLRWVVDWADHVWVEVLLGEDKTSSVRKIGRWVHCDPCEAIIDEPLLYEGWGKNQTYILAFYNPFNNNDNAIDKRLVAAGQNTRGDYSMFEFPPLEDVTSTYTTDDLCIIADRRGIDTNFVAEVMQEVSSRLTEMLQYVPSSTFSRCYERIGANNLSEKWKL